MRKPIIIGNWKMNKTVAEVRNFFSEVDDLSDYAGQIQYGVAPTTLTLITAEEANIDPNFIIAAQDAHFQESGAYTGAVSYTQLQDAGVNYVIVGHSERREMFNDTDEVINLKVKALLNHHMIPILCCGETLAEFETGVTNQIVESQLRQNLKDVKPNQIEKVVIAYEPIWAIGTGKTATPEIAQDTCHAIRLVLKDMFGEEIANKVRIQYGGSVKPNNIREIMLKDDIDGALVGGASLDPQSFADLIRNAL